MSFSSAHLCRNCGRKYGDHAAAGNPACPEDRCPGERFPLFPTRPTATPERSEAKLTAKLRRFWNERQTVFLPR